MFIFLRKNTIKVFALRQAGIKNNFTLFTLFAFTSLVITFSSQALGMEENGEDQGYVLKKALYFQGKELRTIYNDPHKIEHLPEERFVLHKKVERINANGSNQEKAT